MPTRLTRPIYEAFQRADLGGWESAISPDVRINSPAGYGIRGLSTFQEFGKQFTALAHQIDLLDEFEWIDSDGNGRGVITFNLHWKHTDVFGPLQPTGREGTSVESMIFTIAAGQVSRIDVIDASYDLALYLWERGWPMPHNVRPEPTTASNELTRALHHSLAEQDFDLLETLLADAVVVDGPHGFGRIGREPFVGFLREAATTWRRNTLVDEALHLDPDGDGRGLISYLLDWKHDAEVFGRTPTGREGTQVDTMLLTVEDGLITRVHLGSNTVDVPAYLWARGVPLVHGVRSEPIVVGVDRRPA